MGTDQNNGLDAIMLEKLLLLVHKHTGITMSKSKRNLLEGRLRHRLKFHGLNDYSQYIDYLVANREEEQHFINAVTTNETSFFRTLRVWDYFQKEFLPFWHRDYSHMPLKIWSAAAATGEEAYTIAICCQEFQSKNQQFKYEITGTDIDTNVLAQAEKGIYKNVAIEELKNINKAFPDKYFGKSDDAFQIANTIKNRVKFSYHNLLNPPPVKKFYDIIFLRNVLIYFEMKDQGLILNKIAESLIDGGTLIVGESESLSHLNTVFEFRQPLIYTKRGS